MRRVLGVVDVVNEIAVVPPPVTDEVQIGEVIERVFRRHAELDAQNITVELMGQTVILRGVVSSWSEREEAEKVAWRSPGVKHVNNVVHIEP